MCVEGGKINMKPPKVSFRRPRIPRINPIVFVDGREPVFLFQSVDIDGIVVYNNMRKFKDGERMRISIVNGSVEYDGEPVLTEINFDIHDKEKIALVGRNGCGKTTLLKAIAGEAELVRGTGEANFGYFVTGKPVIGYMRQVAFSDENTTLYEEVLGAYKELTDTERRMNEAEAEMEKNSTEQNVRVYSALHEKYEISGGYTYKSECITAIRKFGFTEEEMSRSLTEFSGGQRTKIALLKLLLSNPDVLLLDEPTNHLDIQAIEWLEKYLENYKKSYVIVSHDRMFIDRTADVVYEIEYGETTRYKGNYGAFTVQKREAYEKSVKDAVLKKREIERLEKIVEKFRYKANKAAMAQAKLAQIRRLGSVSEPNRYDNATFRAEFQPVTETVKKTFVADKLCFGYGKILGTVSFILDKGDKLGVIGANGCGKSTFIHTVMNLLPPISGAASFGLHSEIGYFDQTATQSASDKTVLEDFLTDFPKTDNTRARTVLGSFMFYGEDVYKRVCDLSGGEKVRLALCKIFKRRPNVLVLDEPTNHMDLVGKDTFEDMLKNYEGTVIVVSHDRYLIDSVCNKILAFGDGNAKLYECGYHEYELKRAAEEKENADDKTGAPQAHAKSTARRVSEEKERTRKSRRMETLEAKITAAETEINALKDKMNAPSVCSDYVEIMKLQNEIDERGKSLETLVSEWETLGEELGL